MILGQLFEYAFPQSVDSAIPDVKKMGSVRFEHHYAHGADMAPAVIM